ncbi:uncharacterized protein BJ171DRAFT_438598 [Polychytrium aggregatum]|uniref:uncharacterized protein n=1 Tax=Polychytrium aggregatum TaxID=110093 RepID=UPI0022FEB81D|nr:uncharacterized protein BJ171DRAFT_438598 [Polychytrium aggregatum]KAI9208291.1 hypothetical protein BJ171DRAFT_438598 [Polychytrium aggregatum]
MKLLDFHQKMAADFLPPGSLPQDPLASPSPDNPLPMQLPYSSPEDGDGLMIAAKGLGIRSVILTFLKIYASPSNLVLLINTPLREAESYLDDLALDDPHTKAHINVINQATSAERSLIYLGGGVVSVSSRVLVVDLLNKVVPVEKITGIIVNHAHRVTETSTEAFILRLFRTDNKVGFIKAFSDDPELFVGLLKLERAMRTLYLRRVFLWPRFQNDVATTLAKQGSVDVIEIKVPLTMKMKMIQAAILECMESCLADIKRSNASLETEELTIENSLFRSFDLLLASQVDPVLHRITGRARQALRDIRTLRTLLEYLTQYDCVTFYSFLDTILAANSAAFSSIFRSDQASTWLFLEAADSLITLAKQRVYKKIDAPERREGSSLRFQFQPILEEQPKWKVLKDIIREIESERKSRALNEEDCGPVLIMTNGDRIANQLRDILSDFDCTIIKSDPDAAPPAATAQPTSADQAPPDYSRFCTEGCGIMLHRLLGRYFHWKRSFSSGNPRPAVRPSGDGYGGEPNPSGWSDSKRSGPPPTKRRRVRGASVAASLPSSRPARDSKSFDEDAFEVAEFLSKQDELPNLTDGIDAPPVLWPTTEDDTSVDSGLISLDSITMIRPYASTSTSISGDRIARGDDDARMLEELRPRWIIMYDVDVGFIRRVELFKAMNPDIHVKVYFLIYDNSVEEQIYLSSLRREKNAFEKLIYQKSIMAIPVEQDGRVRADPEQQIWNNLTTRVAGGQRTIPASETNLVVVDTREFGSSLPSLVHARGMKVVPTTLEVGDYVLSPQICVERKSIPDLIASFKSGRLYTQCEAMCHHYLIPILLIEFDEERSFTFQGLGSARVIEGGRNDDVRSKIALLCLNLPKLKIIWSSSPKATADIFQDLKENQPEPNAAAAAAIGVESAMTDSVYSLMPMDLLRAIPGITSRNYRTVLNSVGSLMELANMDLEKLAELIGRQNAIRVLEFFEKSPTQ